VFAAFRGHLVCTTRVFFQVQEATTNEDHIATKQGVLSYDETLAKFATLLFIMFWFIINLLVMYTKV